MYRIDDSSAAATLPTPESAGAEGFFTEGVPGSVPATLARASWLNMIQEELRAIVVAGGLTPLKTTYNQVLLALRSAGVFVTQSLSDSSTKAATTEFVHGVVDASIPPAQTWQLMSGSRDEGTDYTNDTGRTITLAVTLHSSPLVPRSASIAVDGANFVYAQMPIDATPETTSTFIPMTLTIPAGAVYRVNASPGALVTWNELR